jgi:hypothetical protein
MPALAPPVKAMANRQKAAGGFVGKRLGSVRIWRFAALGNRPRRIRKQQLEPIIFWCWR